MIDKKILHVVNISFVLPYFIGDQFDYFMEKGVKFYVACQSSVHLTDYSKQKGFTPIGLNSLREVNIIEDIKAIYMLIRLIKREQIDIVIAHTPKGGLLGMIAAYLAGVKIRVYFRHGLMFETSKGLKRLILKTVERFTGSLATKVVCVSPSVLKISNGDKLSAVKKNILLNKGTCNGIDAIDRFKKESITPEQIEKLRAQYGITAENRVIGYVGRLVNDKGISELLTAWKELIKVESNIKLFLVGPLEERDTLSEDLQFYLKNTPSIIYTGLVGDIAPYYRLIDIFILPSYREGFPTVVLEASAFELPVLTTRATGCIDSILENKTGMFIDLDPADIVNKVRKYLNNPALIKEHGKNGRAFILENFGQHEIWKEIERKVLLSN